MTKLSKLRYDDLVQWEPKSARQADAADLWHDEENLVLSGSAGTGKTFLGLALGLDNVLSPDYPEYKKLVIIRSVVPTRDIGFLPGSEEEKTEVYKVPYIEIFSKICKGRESFKRAEANGQVEFEITSFLRGRTFENCIILVDEMQNCNGRELNTIMTRVGRDCKVIFSGDFYQSDFFRDEERRSILTFLKIIDSMTNFSTVEFQWADIVRSDIVRDFIIAKEKLIKEEQIDAHW